MNRNGALVLCMVAAQSALAARAHAMLDFGLQINAPADAGCTSAQVLQHAIEERVGSLVFLDDPQPSRRIAVSIAPDNAASAWNADIVMRDDTGKVVGERRVTTKEPTCDALDEALVVVISTLIGIADQTPPPQPAEQPAQPNAPVDTEKHTGREESAAPEEDADAAATPAPTFVSTPASEGGASHLQLAASVAARGDFGLLPGFAPGAALALDLDFGAWAVVLSGALLPYATQDLGAGARARFVSAVGDAQLCLDAFKPRAAVLAFCAGGEAGVLAVRTAGLAVHASRAEPLVRALFGPRLYLAFQRRVGLLASLAAAVPIYAPRYFVYGAAGGRQYYHSVDLGISAQIGMYWLFSS